ncbi:MAG: hypothetical protein K0S47_1067 [Herbinix sp.]|jgi:uncharacterized protein YjdB/murein DD-endopeptidase MepM/ murein hydrolase activator NlpD|nr:hypothetical protein [Herbinix sp.]
MINMKKISKTITVLMILTLLFSQSTFSAFFTRMTGSETAYAAVSASKITLDQKSLTLEEGKSQSLKVTISPSNASNKKISWSSSNKNIAAVSTKGKVTAISEGKAIITAKTSNGKKALCKITVIKAPAKVTAITLNISSITMDIEDLVSLEASITPEEEADTLLTWTSDNDSIVSVDSEGTLFPMDTGTAVITVTAENGVKATCIVTVTSFEDEYTEEIIEDEDQGNEDQEYEDQDEIIDKTDSEIPNEIIDETNSEIPNEQDSSTPEQAGSQIPIKAVTLNVSSITLKSGDQTSLVAQIEPYNATDRTITWASNNASIASVDNYGNVKANTQGKAIITASSNNGIKASCEVIITDEPQRVMLESGTYLFTLKGTEVCLEVSGASNVNGANVQVYQSNHTDAQVWSIENHEDGTVSFIPLCATNKVLDVMRTNNSANGALKAGCNVDIYDHNDVPAQHFYLDQFSDGSYVIRLSSNPNLVVQATSASSGSNVNVGNYDETNNLQRWFIATASDPSNTKPVENRRTGYIYNTGGLGVFVRNQGSTSGAVVGGFAEGQEITIIGEIQNGWYQVEGKDRNSGATITGYSHGDYITFTKATENSTSNATYLWPVPGVKYISGYYSSGHVGLDIATNAANTVVVAARGGVVIECAPNTCYHVSKRETGCNWGMGNYIKIKHEDGTYATYMHLAPDTFYVTKGQTVKQGDSLAIMGSSGNSSGQHLHFQLSNPDKSTINVNPDSLHYGNY